MLVARKECLGTIELPAQGKLNSIPVETHQDGTLEELFHRLGQTGEISLVASPIKNRLADVPRLNVSLIGCDLEYAPADLIALEVELAQELSLVLARLQR
jgi:hypothetical protein